MIRCDALRTTAAAACSLACLLHKKVACLAHPSAFHTSPPRPTQDAIICLTDLTTFKPAGLVALQELGDAVPALCSHPSEDHTLFAAAGSSALQLDLRRGLDASAVCRCFDINAEEVNSVAVSAANGGWLAAGDDAGEVQVISLAPSGGSSSSPADGAGGVAAAAVLLRPERPASYKTLRRGHSNICAAVAFRPHRPWELLSGGLDSTVVRWDFNRLRPLQSWNLAGEATASGGAPGAAVGWLADGGAGVVVPVHHRRRVAGVFAAHAVVGRG